MSSKKQLSAQQHLDIAWRYKHQSVEFLAEKLGCIRRTAREYQRIVDAGVTVVAEKTDALWEEAARRLREGEAMPDIAISYGYTPFTFRSHFARHVQDEEPLSLASYALRLPFSRFGELPEMMRGAA